ncbi:hypothetical protein IVA79_18065 [Bradyrhizobium sp. 138]|uniref:hypothetical protein n=1 Tax=Bradyrhizobium sp. 138 TaxID=2782615 RepID=UPI001FF86B4D|nr:hypothetical protein [Bradyrhizobium sp. 138]MCK1735792.1 hypothetical protein [Bradyrhizobium sp. 138]
MAILFSAGSLIYTKRSYDLSVAKELREMSLATIGIRNGETSAPALRHQGLRLYGRCVV